MTAFLVISAIGNDRPGIVKALSASILQHECNIDDSRMAILGGEFAIILMLSGSRQQIEMLKAHLPQMEASTGLTIVSRDTRERQAGESATPYAVDIVTMDHPGIVHQVTDFFAQQNINIDTLETETYAAAHTGTPMFAMYMAIQVPAAVSISGLKREFELFCDQENLDGSLEAIK